MARLTAQPDADGLDRPVLARALSWAEPGDDPSAVAAMREWLARRAPSPLRDGFDPAEAALCGEVRLGDPTAAPRLGWLLPATALKPAPRPRALLALLWLDPKALADEADLRQAWRRFLAAANLLQFLPAAPALVAEGVATGIYEQAGWRRVARRTAPCRHRFRRMASRARRGGRNDRRARALDGSWHRRAGDHYELTGTAGAIIVEAELAWEDARIAVLRSDQAEQAPAWRAAGWTVAIVAGGSGGGGASRAREILMMGQMAKVAISNDFLGASLACRRGFRPRFPSS